MNPLVNISVIETKVKEGDNQKIRTLMEHIKILQNIDIKVTTLILGNKFEDPCKITSFLPGSHGLDIVLEPCLGEIESVNNNGNNPNIVITRILDDFVIDVMKKNYRIIIHKKIEK